MRSRIYGITKDIVIIFLFALLVYGATHNSIVRPKEIIPKGSWSIELRQRPLVMGIAGHNYIALRNDAGNIVGQLHGLPMDTETGEWKYVGRKKTDILRVFEFDEKNNNTDLMLGYGVILMTTNHEQVIAVWKKAQKCKDEINTLSLPYPPFGISLQDDTENSNSVAYTLLKCMNLDSPHLGLFTPGWGKNLLK